MAAIIRAVLAPLLEILVDAIFRRIDRPEFGSVSDPPSRLPSIVEDADADLVRRGAGLLRDAD